WIVTRFSGDPVWLQVVHFVIALGIWTLIWRASPFTLAEKFLLLVGYYLFWEYFGISRSFAIGVLLGFRFLVLRQYWPQKLLWSWLLLGLLANTSVFAAIWAIGMGLFHAWDERHRWREMLPGIAVFAALLALSVASMTPAPDNQLAAFAPVL